MNNYMSKEIECGQFGSPTNREEKFGRERKAWHAYDIGFQLGILRNRNIIWPLALHAEPLPDAKKVASEIRLQLSSLAKATDTTNALLIGAWNMLFLDPFKANYFLDTYKEILTCHHLLAVEEVNFQALSIIGRACGYGYFTSTANSRGQAVGFLLHPRLEVIRRVEYPQITGIYDIPDLRPALQLDLYDNVARKRFSVVVVHLKSMRGGEGITGMVRFRQLQKLMEIIGETGEPTLVLGDFNCRLNSTSNTSPLTANGFALFDAEDETSTQAMGGRLDGVFHKNLPPSFRLGDYSVHRFWSSSIIGSTLSDHALLTWKMDFGRSIPGGRVHCRERENHVELARAA